MGATELLSLRYHVGEALYTRYLQMSGGDVKRAEAHHRLDVELRNGFRPLLECVEVAMRCRYHDTMMDLRPAGAVWLVDPALPVRGIVRRRARAVLTGLEMGTLSPGEAINRLSFSFWPQLTARPLEKILWVPFLHRAYEPGVSRRRIHTAVERTVKLRNRVHHYEIVVDLPLEEHVAEMLWLLNCLMPGLAEECRQASTLPALLDRLKNGV